MTNTNRESSKKEKMSRSGRIAKRSVLRVIQKARPAFRNAQDKVAFAVHASFVASGYVLRATGSAAFARGITTAKKEEEEGVGITGWNEFSPYAFLYSAPHHHHGKKKKALLLVYCLAMDDNSNRLSINALKVDGGDDGKDDVHLKIYAGDFVSDNYHPRGNSEERRRCSYRSMFRSFRKLVRMFGQEILEKLDKRPPPPPLGDMPSSSWCWSHSGAGDEERPPPPPPPPSYLLNF